MKFQIHRLHMILQSTIFVTMFGYVPAQAQTLGSVLSFEFGKIAASSAGTVILATGSNTRTKTGGVSLVAGGTVRRGRVVVSGTPSTAVNISVPSGIVVTGSSGGTATLNPAINNGPVQTTSAAGTLTIRFGGTLVFTGAAPTGTYSAIVPVTVIY
jgi:type 1 fimbria pilin